MGYHSTGYTPVVKLLVFDEVIQQIYLFRQFFPTTNLLTQLVSSEGYE